MPSDHEFEDDLCAIEGDTSKELDVSVTMVVTASGKKALALLDSGAGKTYVSEDWMKRNGGFHLLPASKPYWIRGALVEVVERDRRVGINLSFGTFSTRIHSRIAPLSNYDIILGRDFIGPYAVTTSWREDLWIFEDDYHRRHEINPSLLAPKPLDSQLNAIESDFLDDSLSRTQFRRLLRRRETQCFIAMVMEDGEIAAVDAGCSVWR